MTPKNPFRATGSGSSAQGVLAYIERDADRALRRALLDNQRFPFVYGPRQSGKSSLLAHAAAGLDPSEFCAVVVDVSQLRLSDARAFMSDLLGAIAREADLNKREIDAEAPEDTLLAWLGTFPQRLVVLLDEVEVLRGASFAEAVLGKLRFLFNVRGENDEFVRVQFALCGAVHPSRLIPTQLAGPYAGADIALTPLLPDQVDALVKNLGSAGVPVDPELGPTLYRATGGVLYLCQELLQPLWERAAATHTPITPADIEREADKLVDQAGELGHFMGIYGALSTDEGLLASVLRLVNGLAISEERLLDLQIIGICNATQPFVCSIYERVFGTQGPLSLAVAAARRAAHQSATTAQPQSKQRRSDSMVTPLIGDEAAIADSGDLRPRLLPPTGIASSDERPPLSESQATPKGYVLPAAPPSRATPPMAMPLKPSSTGAHAIIQMPVPELPPPLLPLLEPDAEPQKDSVAALLPEPPRPPRPLLALDADADADADAEKLELLPEPPRPPRPLLALDADAEKLELLPEPPRPPRALPPESVAPTRPIAPERPPLAQSAAEPQSPELFELLDPSDPDRTLTGGPTALANSPEADAAAQPVSPALVSTTEKTASGTGALLELGDDDDVEPIEIDESDEEDADDPTWVDKAGAMPMPKKRQSGALTVSREEVRALLDEHLLLTSELDAFVQLYFRKIAQQFAPGMSRAAKTELLLTNADLRSLTLKLGEWDSRLERQREAKAAVHAPVPPSKSAPRPIATPTPQTPPPEMAPETKSEVKPEARTEPRPEPRHEPEPKVVDISQVDEIPTYRPPTGTLGVGVGLVLANRYFLTSEVGTGPVTVVWNAYDRIKDEQVALKLMHGAHAEDPQLVERFWKSAQQMAALSHPAITSVLNKPREENGIHYMVQEFLPGGNLRQVVLGGKLTRQQLVRVLQRLSAALQYAQERKVTHGNIHPNNILFDAAGHARLTDFQQVWPPSVLGAALAQRRFFVAPEEAGGHVPVDLRADVYSLGMCALFALHGQELPPRALEDRAGFIMQLDGPAELKAALLRATSPSPGDRFATIGDLLVALEADGPSLPGLSRRLSGQFPIISAPRPAAPPPPAAAPPPPPASAVSRPPVAEPPLAPTPIMPPIMPAMTPIPRGLTRTQPGIGARPPGERDSGELQPPMGRNPTAMAEYSISTERIQAVTAEAALRRSIPPVPLVPPAPPPPPRRSWLPLLAAGLGIAAISGGLFAYVRSSQNSGGNTIVATNPGKSSTGGPPRPVADPLASQKVNIEPLQPVGSPEGKPMVVALNSDQTAKPAVRDGKEPPAAPPLAAKEPTTEPARPAAKPVPEPPMVVALNTPSSEPTGAERQVGSGAVKNGVRNPAGKSGPESTPAEPVDPAAGVAQVRPVAPVRPVSKPVVAGTPEAMQPTPAHPIGERPTVENVEPVAPEPPVRPASPGTRAGQPKNRLTKRNAPRPVAPQPVVQQPMARTQPQPVVQQPVYRPQPQPQPVVQQPAYRPQPQPVVQQPIARPQPVRPAAPGGNTTPDGEAALRDAQSAFVRGDRQGAIAAALRVTERGGEDAVKAWRFVGNAACSVRSPALASSAYRHIRDTDSRQRMVELCQRNGMVYADGQFSLDD